MYAYFRKYHYRTQIHILTRNVMLKDEYREACDLILSICRLIGRPLTRAERNRIKFFVCDMWQPYVDLVKAYFPNATVIIDKYHFIRYVTWAIENVRKRLQKKMPTSLRKYYQRSRKLILTRYQKLKDENKKACDLMLLYNDDLRVAHHLKE